MNLSCSNQDPCPVILDSKCVIYEGENLLYIGVTTNDNYRTALENINTAIGNIILAGGITQLTGDVIAYGPGIATATLATVNSTPGQYGSSTAIPKLTVDGKGRVTAITTEAVFIPSGALSFIGDVTGTGNTGTNTTLTLATVNSNIYTSNTFLKFAANGKGLVTSATPVVSADITGALGFTPYNSTNPSNFISRLGLSASSPLSYDSATGNFTIQQANATQNGYLSSTDWGIFNSKQAAGNYITDLTGEATATGPGIANVTLNNSAVTGKVLTGVNITGGSIVATDSILTAFGKVQNQINSLIGGSIYQGTWNANTNTPALTSGVGTKGYYYIVSVAGSTNLDGITDWNLGDWAIFDGTAWQQVDNTDAVVSVNGFTGAVSLTTDNISEGLTNQYFTTSRARLALSGGTGISYDNVTGVITNSSPDQTVAISSGAGINVTGTYPNFTIASTITQYTDALARQAISLTTTGTSGAATYNNTTGILNIPNYAPDLSGYVPTSRTLTINGTSYDLTADRSWTIATNSGTVTSVAVTETGDALTITGSPITTSGTINIGFAGVASQYVRGDGNLANFPTSGGGGGGVSYYLNGSVNQGTFVGNTYYEMSKVPIVGANTDFTINADGYISQFITDAGDPALLEIPGGNWNFEVYFSASSAGGTPSFYVELYKYDGTTFTLISSSSATPEGITGGTAIDLYITALAVPTTSLTLTDRLAVRVYVTHSGRTITLHTQGNHLCQVITTFSTGVTALNGLTAQVQYFQTGTSGTDFNISSTTATHTFNIPDASATARGLITTGTQTITGAKTFSSLVTFNNKIYLQSDPLYSTGIYLSSYSANSLIITTNNGFNSYLQELIFPNSNRFYTFPSTDGTLALTSDIPSLSGYVPTSRILTINGVSYNLTADASWTVSAGTTLNGTGFVKASGTTITYDNSTYYLASNPSGFITSSGSISGNAATATNASQLNGISSVQLFNNMNNIHGTYQDFNSVGNFGFRYMQGSTNGPGSGQFYGMTLGLGSEYAYGTYGSQLYWLRNTTNPYIWIRYQENGSWGAWTKAAAGYADSAGTAASLTTAQNVVFSNGRKGLVGVYDAAQTQAIFAMGASYVLTDGGASSNIGPLYGLGWSYNPGYGGAGNNPQSKAGLNHQLLHMQNGITTTAIGSGIWTDGSITATGDITAYYSDMRLKTKISNIDNALDKIMKLNGFYYVNNDVAKEYGYTSDKVQIGVSAQEVESILPEIVMLAPFDATGADAENPLSKSGEHYKTVKYDKLVPLLIEAIKEQQTQIEELKTITNGFTK